MYEPDNARVIPIGVAQRRGALEVCLVEIETRDRAFILRWRLRLLPNEQFGLAEARGPRGPELRYDIRDDEGNRFEDTHRGSKGGGNESLWEQSDTLQPALSPSAARLFIRIVAVELERLGASGELPHMTWNGPWEFEVPLRESG